MIKQSFLSKNSSRMFFPNNVSKVYYYYYASIFIFSYKAPLNYIDPSSSALFIKSLK